MKTAEYYWDHPRLKPFLKKIAEGEYLFRQGDSGNSMFIITQGIAELLAERDGKLHVMSLMDAGEFLGERAVVTETPHQRVFSARAKTDLAVFEISLSDVEQLKKTEPELMADILKRIFQIAADRLHKSNQLINALRSSDNWERVVRIILHLCRTSGRRIEGGIEVLLSAESIDYFIDLEDAKIEEALAALQKQKLIERVAGSEHAYLIPSERALLKAIEGPSPWSNPVRKAG